MKKPVSLLILTLVCMAMQAATWYVKPNAESTVWADKNAAQIKSDLLEAFVAAAAGDEIWISAGTHYYAGPSHTDINKNIKFYGGFAGTESNLSEREHAENTAKWEFTNTTIIEPKDLYAGTLFKIPSGQSVLFNGIKFQNFKNFTLGIRQNTIVENCIFYNNAAPTSDGAAISIYPGGSVKNCYFLKNTSKSGSAIFANIKSQNARIEGCLFEENTTTDGANGGAAINIKHSSGHDAAFTATIVDCIFRNNVCNIGNYPSIVLIKTPYASISDCVITNNTGRALDIFAGKGSNLTIANNVGTNGEGAVFISNTQATINGILSVPELYNTVIWGNKRSVSDATAQGIVVKAGDQATISNLASEAPNTLAAPATEDLIYQLSTSNDGAAEGALYPRFVAPSSFTGAGTDEVTITAARNANYSMSSTSALIDKGNDLFIDGSINYDIAGNERFQDTSIDLGAYEIKGVSSSVERNNIAGLHIFNHHNILSVEAPASILSLYDMTGATVATTSVQSGKVELSLNRGIYLLILTTDNGDQYSHKVIMQ